MLKKFCTLLIASTSFFWTLSWAAAPLVNPIEDQFVAVGDTISVRISGWDPDGGVPGLYIENMPNGASFDDNGDGTRTFTWTPDDDGFNFYSWTVVATDAQEDGSIGTGELFLIVDDYEFLDYYDEPELLDVTDFALTNIHPNGNFYLYSLSYEPVYHVSIAEDVDAGFGYSEDFIFGIGPRNLEIYSNFGFDDGYGNFFNYFDELESNRQFAYGTQSRITADSERLLVLDGAYEPAVIYENIADVWIEESKLEPPLSINAAQRYTGSIAIDHHTIVSGHPADDELNNNRLAGSGAVRVYEYESSEWSNTVVIKAPNADEHDQFGSSLALDGDLLVVSAIGEGGAGRGSDADMLNNDFTSDRPYSSRANTSGAVYVFERVSDSWVNTAYLKASDNTATLRFGWDVAIDGDKIYVGAPGRNTDTSEDYFDYNGNPIDENEGAVYVFEKNSAGKWTETHIIEPKDTETKFGLYLSAKNEALAVGSAVATSLFAFQDDQWTTLWFSRVAPYSVALDTNALAIGTPEGLKVLTVDSFYYADEDYIALDAPVFYGDHYYLDGYSKTINAGEEVAIVISAQQVDGVPGLYLKNSELNATFEDNLDGTRTFRWQSSIDDSGVYRFEVVASHASDASVTSTESINIYIND